MHKGKIIFISLYIVVCVTSCKHDTIELMPGFNDSNCDTSAIISYTHDIVPIMNSSCGALDNSCHTSSAASGNVILDLYIGVNYVALNGSMMSSITWDGHASPMPKTGGRLSNCKTMMIKKWLSEGAPQN